MADELQSWRRPRSVRRYCKPHRGEWLKALGMASVVQATLVTLLEPAIYVAMHAPGWVLWFSVVALLSPSLGGVVWALAARDLMRMRAGRMDPEGRPLTEQALGLGQVAVSLSLLSTCTWKIVWLASWLGWP